MQSIIDFFSHNSALMGALVVAILDAVISAHPGLPADGVLGLIKSGIQALIGSQKPPAA